MLSSNRQIDIYCADIGSVAGGNFGWHVSFLNGSTNQGVNIEELAESVAASLDQGRPVALGFEAPMFAPYRHDPRALTKKRNGETNPNWIGGPGSAVLATALAQVPWILREVKDRLNSKKLATLDWCQFRSGIADMFLWEAFVSGVAKGRSHTDDARIAAEAFVASLPDPRTCNAIQEPEVLSLLGAALLRTGWSTDIQLLSQSCVVIKA